MPNTTARKPRSIPPDAELRLWRHLRRRQFDGFKFRRAHPLGPYVVDFANLETRLVIELDSGRNAENSNTAERTAWLEAEGFRVLRFLKNDVLADTGAVLAQVRVALEAGRKTPPPAGGSGPDKTL